MATIKDVSKLAGVSLGTVSNVLNGKTNNEELIEKVEKAINDLSYRPDAVARGLKNTRSNIIGVVIPDVVQPQYHEFLMTLEKHLRTRGFNLLVHFSHGNRLLEAQSVDSLLDMKVASIVIYSASSYEFQDKWSDCNIPMLLITGENRVKFHGNIIFLDYSEAFQKVLNLIDSNENMNIGLVVERGLYERGRLKEIFLNRSGDSSLVVLAESSKEAGFKSAFELNHLCGKLDAIIVGSQALGEGMVRGLARLGKTDIPVYAIKGSSWIEDANIYKGVISLSHHDVAVEAVHNIADVIQRPAIREQTTYNIVAELKQSTISSGKIVKAKNDLHFAMYDCSSARSLQMYSTIYEKAAGKRIYFDMFSYGELETLLYEHAEQKNSRYDGFMIDIAWFQGLVESGLVKNLDHILKNNKSYLNDFEKNAVRDYGMYVESLYAIPFMSGSQILFYQRDLFGNSALRRKFERKYHEELVPPESWVQFNTIAEFFTQKYNPASPVKYGVSMSYGDNVYTTIDFLDRLWAYGGKLFDDFGNVVINSSSAVAALKSLRQSYLYSSGAILDSWDKVAMEFSEGNSAMAILYNSDVGDINNPTKSKIAGNLGYSLIPGKIPVQGGWSLGLNSYGKHTEEAERFLLWACDKGNGIPLTIMGGSTLRSEYYRSQDIEKTQPWKRLVEQTLSLGRKRAMPEIWDESRWKNKIYTEIIPGEILKVINGEQSESAPVDNMAEKIEQLTGE